MNRRNGLELASFFIYFLGLYTLALLAYSQRIQTKRYKYSGTKWKSLISASHRLRQKHLHILTTKHPGCWDGHLRVHKLVKLSIDSTDSIEQTLKHYNRVKYNFLFTLLRLLSV